MTKSSDIKAFLCARSGAQKEAPHLKFANQKVQDKKLLSETHTCLDRENHEKFEIYSMCDNPKLNYYSGRT